MCRHEFTPSFVSRAVSRPPDWKLRVTYGATTVANQLAQWVNVRQEFRATDEIAVPTADNRKVASIRCSARRSTNSWPTRSSRP